MNSSPKRTILRASLGKNVNLSNMPHLLEIQLDSYQKIFERDPINHRNLIDDVFYKHFPVTNVKQNCIVEYLGMHLDDPIYIESLYHMSSLNFTYAYKAYFEFKLTFYKKDKKDKKDKVVIETQTVTLYAGDIPKMTPEGSFIIGGQEKVVVLQLIRSPGLLFLKEKVSIKEKDVYPYARIIPERGSWLEISLEKNILYAKIDKKKKFPATVLFTALNYSEREILEIFYSTLNLKIVRSKEDQIKFILQVDKLRVGQTLPFNCLNIAAYTPLQQEDIDALSSQEIEMPLSALINSRLLEYKVRDKRSLAKNTNDAEKLFSNIHLNYQINQEFIQLLKVVLSVTSITVATSLHLLSQYEVAQTIEASKLANIDSQTKALILIAQIMRGTEMIVNIIGNHDKLFEFYLTSFFKDNKYSLSKIGRFKMNYKLGLTSDSDHLTQLDLIAIIKNILSIQVGEREYDVVDCLENKILKTVKDHILTIVNNSVYKIAKQASDTISKYNQQETPKQSEILHLRQFGISIMEFFQQSPICQFIDQDNPLSKLSHKRRITSLGPGGVNKTHTGTDIRDIDHSSYSRICPVETPEGLNIGLINSLSNHVSIDQHGLISAPFEIVKDGRCTGQVIQVSALDDKKYKIAPRTIPMDRDGNLLSDYIHCRFNRENEQHKKDKIDLIDVFPGQFLSASAALIPCIEHNDVKRALMGANIQKQAVPLLIPEYPLIGTGIENKVAKDAKAYIECQQDGIVVIINNDFVVLKNDDISKEALTCYRIYSSVRTKKNTRVHHRILVKIGERCQKGDIIADGSCSENAEIALGTNLKIAYISLEGYNFEDSIVLSESILQQQKLTSIHIHELVCNVYETQLGDEEVTRDIPGAPSEDLTKLDEKGIIYIGADVKPGDILVGKITPKAEEKSTPEDRLLRAIFGEKISEVSDSSLRVPHNLTGTVIDVNVVNTRDKSKEGYELELITSLAENEMIIYDYLNKYIALKPIFKINHREIDAEENYLIFNKFYENIEERGKAIEDLINKLKEEINVYRNTRLAYKKSLHKQVLDSSVIERIKITIASQIPIQQGDKISSRHGNKGTISSIFQIADMPYMEDGQSVDMIFTPLGIPSRMNIGQLFEINLGLISLHLGLQLKDLIEAEADIEEIKKLLVKIYNKILNSSYNFDALTNEDVMLIATQSSKGIPMISPSFDGISYEELEELMVLCGFEKTGNFQLYDGKTGRPLDNKSCVGILYCLKLDHLVENKIHSRSVGPYSLITQQPLSGRSHFGGQRVGEMECWAIEAYGASYILQEMLTVKSDDLEGRNKMYNNILHGKHDLPPQSNPESFNVLKQEIKALCINLEPIKILNEALREIKEEEKKDE